VVDIGSYCQTAAGPGLVYCNAWLPTAK
jgi:hypothetical protein